MAIQTQWRIRSHADRCARSGERFADGQVFYTCLTPLEDAEGYLREDFSEPAWNEIRATRQPFSFWRSVYEEKPDPDREPASPLAQDDALSLLQRLLEEDPPSHPGACYVLALMLERKKQLRQVGRETPPDGSPPLLVYEHRASGEILLVPDPAVSLDQVEDLEREVRLLLSPAPPGPEEPGKDDAPDRTPDPAQATASACVQRR